MYNLYYYYLYIEYLYTQASVVRRLKLPNCKLLVQNTILHVVEHTQIGILAITGHLTTLLDFRMHSRTLRITSLRHMFHVGWIND